MFADGHSLLDEAVQILRDGGGESFSLQDTQDLVTSHKADLSDSMGIPQDNTCKENLFYKEISTKHRKNLEMPSADIFSAEFVFHMNSDPKDGHHGKCTRTLVAIIPFIHRRALTDLGWGETLLGELVDLLLDIFG